MTLARKILTAGMEKPKLEVSLIAAVCTGGGTPTFSCTLPQPSADLTYFAMCSSRTNSTTGQLYMSTFRFNVPAGGTQYYFNKLTNGNSAVDNPRDIFYRSGASVPGGSATFTINYQPGSGSAPASHGIVVYAVKGPLEILQATRDWGQTLAAEVGGLILDMTIAYSVTPAADPLWTSTDIQTYRTGYGVAAGRIDPVGVTSFTNENGPCVSMRHA